jgi:hypothetical protein
VTLSKIITKLSGLKGLKVNFRRLPQVADKIRGIGIRLRCADINELPRHPMTVKSLAHESWQEILLQGEKSPGAA